jgi:SWI/SNF-related matrix-associated actin-dependent regulator 1 of chromatin subfamily A
MIKSDPKRPDWFQWWNPPPEWCQAHAEVPGLQWNGDGTRMLVVNLHRSHLALVPLGLGAVAVEVARSVNLPAGITLRPYQAEDIPWLAARRGSLLAYQMRLGKTLASCAVHNPRDGMLVVVGPLASRDVWRTWIERVHGFPPIILQGRDDITPQPGYPAYFVHYEILEAHMAFFGNQKVGTLILDEIHLLQSRKARRTQACSFLSTRADRIIGLSGTPMWSRPDSFYPILHLIAPGAWGTHFSYAKRYANAQPGAHGWDYSGVSNADELSARLKDIMLRRTWAEVAPDLPPTEIVIEPVEVSIKQRAEVEAAAVRAMLARGTTTTTAGYLATLRRKLAALKVEAAVAAAERGMQDGHKVVVWVWHNEVGEQIAGALTKKAIVYRLRAEDSANVREAQVAAFHAHVGPAVMVVGIAVGGTAIDLSCSDYAVFAEFDWMPANMQQALMRTFSPARPHVVILLYADVDVERKLVDALGVKEGFASAVGLGFEEIAKAVLG